MKTLRDFPQDFDSLVVVTGDRREVPPRSHGDLLAYSVSSTDVMYMNHLRLGACPVVSDKQFVVEPDSRLRERFGRTNILVIGSPAVNLLARRINDKSLFRFNIAMETKDELNEQYELLAGQRKAHEELYIYHQCLEGVFDVDAIVARYRDSAFDIQRLRDTAERIVSSFKETSIYRNQQPGQRPIRYLMHKFDKPGIYDSYADVTWGESPTSWRDYGLISLLPNPFSDEGDFWIVYVAGVHGPGTAVGLLLLNDSEAMSKHPYGGVYEVFLDQIAPYFERILRCGKGGDYKWETRAYETHPVPPILRPNHLTVFLSSPLGEGQRESKENPNQKKFNTNLKSVLKSICRERRIELTIRDPFSLNFSRSQQDFWKAALDFQKECSFVIHDVTEFRRGVMIEVGFSLAVKKPLFLVWNSRKGPFTSFPEGPLRLMHVEELDMDDFENAKEILSQKMLGEAFAGDFPDKCSHCETSVKGAESDQVLVHCERGDVLEFLDRLLQERRMTPFVPGVQFSEEPPVCQLCKSLGEAACAIVDVSADDPNSCIVLGMARAMDIPALPIAACSDESGQDVSKPNPFPYPTPLVMFDPQQIQRDLTDPVVKLLDARSL